MMVEMVVWSVPMRECDGVIEMSVWEKRKERKESKKKGMAEQRETVIVWNVWWEWVG